MKTEFQRRLVGEAPYAGARTDTLSSAFSAKLGRPAQPAARPPMPPAEPAPARLADADALLIALRRSLESCKDTSQLRMLAAFQPPRRDGL